MARQQTQKLKASILTMTLFNSVTESLSSDYKAFKATTEAYINHCTKEVERWNSLALGAKANASDNPRWHEAISGPDKPVYWEATKVQITILTKLKAWEIVPLTQDKKVLDSTWAFKFKRYPDGDICKF